MEADLYTRLTITAEQADNLRDSLMHEYHALERWASDPAVEDVMNTIQSVHMALGMLADQCEAAKGYE